MLAALLDVLAPARCVACDDPSSDLCTACLEAVARAPLVTRNDIAGVLPVVACAAYDGSLRAAILSLKYRNRRSIGVKLGALLARKLPNLACDLVVAVPLHPERQRARGYNQAEIIARAFLGAATDPTLLLRGDVLHRTRSTALQSTLDQSARAENVAGAFGPGRDARFARGCRVLLIDDVVTTGATLRACARVLISLGARSVAAACLAARL